MAGLSPRSSLGPRGATWLASEFALGGMLFFALWLFIGAVSLYDAHLCVEYATWLPQLEQNPVGQWLIELNDGGVTLLVQVKACGTIVALALLALLHRFNKRLASPVVLAVATFQFLLLLYLTFA